MIFHEFDEIRMSSTEDFSKLSKGSIIDEKLKTIIESSAKLRMMSSDDLSMIIPRSTEERGKIQIKYILASVPKFQHHLLLLNCHHIKYLSLNSDQNWWILRGRKWT